MRHCNKLLRNATFNQHNACTVMTVELAFVVIILFKSTSIKRSGAFGAHKLLFSEHQCAKLQQRLIVKYVKVFINV